MKKVHPILFLIFLNICSLQCNEKETTQIIDSFIAKWKATSYKINGVQTLGTVIKSYSMDIRGDNTYTETSIEINNSEFVGTGTWIQAPDSLTFNQTIPGFRKFTRHFSLPPDSLVLRDHNEEIRFIRE